MTAKPHCSELTLSKTLEHVTEDWQPAIDIAGWSELGISCTRACLGELVKRGKIQSMWDGNLGIRYFRVQGAA